MCIHLDYKPSATTGRIKGEVKEREGLSICRNHFGAHLWLKVISLSKMASQTIKVS